MEHITTMKIGTHKKSCLIVCAVWILVNLARIQHSHADLLASRIEAVIKQSKLPRASLGIWVFDEVSNRRVFGLNDNKIMIPASLTKIVTAGAALDEFPPDTQFTTSLWSEKEPSGGVLENGIYIKGGGDPSFVSEKMWKMVSELSRLGIKKIQGDIIADDSLFDTVRFDEDRDSVRVDRAYDAPIGALSFNWNSVNVYVRPGKAVGMPAAVIIDPPNSYIKMKSSAKTGPAHGAKSISVSREKSEGGDLISVSGSIPLDLPEAVVFKSVTKPEMWTAQNLRAFLNEQGIEVTGGIRAGRVPEGAQLLVESRGSRMGDIITDMMKFSNNYVAEMLTKNISLHRGASVGSMKAGVEGLRQFVEKVGIKKGSFVLVNPSGLTNDNKMTTEQLGLILNYVKGKFNIYPEFMTGLPIAGVDGTLKSRIKNERSRGLIRAKTGLLRQAGVAGLAGFAATDEGRVRTFAILYNTRGDIPNLDKVWRVFDGIAYSLTEN